MKANEEDDDAHLLPFLKLSIFFSVIVAWHDMVDTPDNANENLRLFFRIFLNKKDVMTSLSTYVYKGKLCVYALFICGREGVWSHSLVKSLKTHFKPIMHISCKFFWCCSLFAQKKIEWIFFLAYAFLLIMHALWCLYACVLP